MMPTKTNKSLGFSLIELMMVVSIISVLASLGIPKFRTFQAKARQTEAKINLDNIDVLQRTFFADNDRFTLFEGTGYRGSLAPICSEPNTGFKLANCAKVRYNYVGGIYTGGLVFRITANTHGSGGGTPKNLICPGTTTPDFILYDSETGLAHLSDTSIGC